MTSARSARTVAIPSVLLLLSLGACGGEGGNVSGSPSGLQGVTWVLDRGSIDGLVATAPADARVDIRFEADEVGGRSGCNSYGGTYEADGAELSFGALGGTEMACEPASLMELETAYLAALGQVRTYRATDDELVLTGGGARLAFAPEEPAEPLPLVGTRWDLASLGYGGDAVASPVQGTDAHVRFDADGSVTGSTGCNSFGGTYEVESEAIAIGEVRMTLKACEPDVSQQEDVFHRGLVRASTFSIDGDTLTLADAQGAFLVSFTGRGASAG